MRLALIAFIAFLAPSDQALASSPSSMAEPVKCYETAWNTTEEGGLGLPRGQAVELCSGTTNAKRTIQCYAKAWEHPDNGGLGLTAGLAIRLCKENSQDFT